MLGAYGLPLVMLAKQMSLPLESMVGRLGAPVALSGFVMATLVLTPESIAAVKAARQNQLQRSVNVLLGSVLASIGLTIPLVITQDQIVESTELIRITLSSPVNATLGTTLTHVFSILDDEKRT